MYLLSTGSVPGTGSIPVLCPVLAPSYTLSSASVLGHLQWPLSSSGTGISRPLVQCNSIHLTTFLWPSENILDPSSLVPWGFQEGETALALQTLLKDMTPAPCSTGDRNDIEKSYACNVATHTAKII